MVTILHTVTLRIYIKCNQKKSMNTVVLPQQVSLLETTKETVTLLSFSFGWMFFMWFLVFALWWIISVGKEQNNINSIFALGGCSVIFELSPLPRWVACGNGLREASVWGGSSGTQNILLGWLITSQVGKVNCQQAAGEGKLSWIKDVKSAADSVLHLERKPYEEASF